MYSTIIAAVSTDGYIAGPSGDQSWLSVEDQTHMRISIATHDVIIMGSGTFLAHKDFFNANSSKQRAVLTSRPSEFAAYKHLARFVNTNMLSLLQQLSAEGFKNSLILGGARLYEDCLKANLVDKVLLTIEPIVLGDGVQFLTDSKTIADYPDYVPAPAKYLNVRGTMLVSYSKK